MPAVMKISPQGQIRIPKKVMNSLHLMPGDYIELEIVDGQAILKPRKLIDPSQGWHWTYQWQESEKAVDQELQNDRCLPVFQTAEEGLRWLEK